MGRCQLCIFSSRGKQDRKIFVGILPEGKEFFVLQFAGLYVSRMCFDAAKPEVRERKQRRERIESPMGEDVFVLGRRVLVISGPSVGFASLRECDQAAGQFIGRDRLQCSDCIKWFLRFEGDLCAKPGSVDIFR